MQAIKPCQLSSTCLFYFAKNMFLSYTRRLEQSVELKTHEKQMYVKQRVLNKLLA